MDNIRQPNPRQRVLLQQLPVTLQPLPHLPPQEHIEAVRLRFILRIVAHIHILTHSRMFVNTIGVFIFSLSLISLAPSLFRSSSRDTESLSIYPQSIPSMEL